MDRIEDTLDKHSRDITRLDTQMNEVMRRMDRRDQEVRDELKQVNANVLLLLERTARQDERTPGSLDVKLTGITSAIAGGIGAAAAFAVKLLGG